MATATKKKTDNAAYFKMIRARNKDILKYQAEDVQLNTISRFGAGVFAEQDFLIKCIEQLTGNDPSRLKNLGITPVSLDEADPEPAESDSDLG